MSTRRPRASQSFRKASRPSAETANGFSIMRCAPRSRASPPIATCESGGVEVTAPSAASSAAAAVEQELFEIAVVLLEDRRLVGLVPLRARIRRREERLHLQPEAVPRRDVVAQAVEVLIREPDHLVRDRANARLHRPA